MDVRHLAKRLLVGCVAVAATVSVSADSITVDGVTYTNVLVKESPSLYYVQLPEEGRVITVSKSDVDPATVSYTQDDQERAALEARWRDARTPQTLQETTPPSVAPLPSQPGQAAMAPQAPGTAGMPIVIRDPGRAQRVIPGVGNEYVTDGYVPYVNLRNVPLKDALKATLRPMGLDYEVKENYLYVSTPERLRNTSSERLETRYYDLKGGMAETMPKIVVRNPVGVGGQMGFGGQGGFGGGGFGGGQGGFGGGGFGGGQGGFGGGGFGGGQGGFGGGGFGGGGMGGGGFGGGGMGAGTFSNISELFSTIDDRLVGEPPAIIGMGGMTAVGGAGGGFGGQGGMGAGGFGGQGGLGGGGFGGGMGDRR
jgi:hypothetical protein